MWFLLRIVAGLIVVTAACIALIMSANWSESAWACLRYITPTDGLATLDLNHGVYVVEPRRVYLPGLVDEWHYDDFVLFEYLSPNGIRRFGIVADSTSAHLDFTDSADFFAARRDLSPNANYLPILTYDRVTQTQTATIYAIPSLVPQLSVVQHGVILPTSPTGGYQWLSAAWSPAGTWFGFLNPTAAGLLFTLMSPTLAQSYTFPLSGAPEDVLYTWSLTERAVAVSSTRAHDVDIFATQTDDWKVSKHYGLHADASDQPFTLAQWSFDDRSLYFFTYPQDVDLPEGFQYVAFRLDSQRMEVAQEEQINPIMVRLNNRWLCKEDANTGELTLVSLTHPRQPLILAGLGFYFSPCSPFFETPDKTKLVVPTRSSTPAEIAWLGITASPAGITPLPLPATVREAAAWSADSRQGLFFMPATLTSANDQVGQLGILDTLTWQWTLIEPAIAIDLFRNSASTPIAPDATRFVTMAADGHHILLVAMDGHVISSLPIATRQMSVAWSPDSTTLLITDYALPDRPVFQAYSRDGQLLLNRFSPPNFGLWDLTATRQGWSRCEPSLKLPHMGLPS